MNKQSLQKGRQLDQTIESLSSKIKQIDAAMTSVKENGILLDQPSVFTFSYEVNAHDVGVEAYLKILEVVKAIQTDKLAKAEQAFAAL